MAAVAMSALHLEANAAVDWLWRGMTMEAYQQAALWLVLLCGGIFAAVVLWLSPTTRWRLCWLGALSVTALAHGVLVVNHVEAIHFAQFGLLAMLLSVGLTPWRAALLSALLGIGDECVQYFILYADHPGRGSSIYLDGNDMVLDTIGASLGAMLVAMRG